MPNRHVRLSIWTLNSSLYWAGMYLRKAKTRSSGCSYPKVFMMKPSFVTKVSPSMGVQTSGCSSSVSVHRKNKVQVY